LELNKGHLYQVWDYPKKHNFQRQTSPKKCCNVFVILDDVKDGIAQARIWYYTERPQFLPCIRKGLKVYFPLHYLRPPKQNPNLAKDPLRWVSRMESELNEQSLNMNKEVMAKVIEICAKAVRPQRIEIKPNQTWVNDKLRERYIILRLSAGAVIYKEKRKTKSMD